MKYFYFINGLCFGCGIVKYYDEETLRMTALLKNIEHFVHLTYFDLDICILLQMEELDVNALNNTRKSPKDILFFNRVPKVGSQTFMEMLRRLSARNKFDFHRDHIQRVETIRIGVREQVIGFIIIRITTLAFVR